ncbi:MAG: hypothetical protein R3B13_12220 [Polyangiaceae bacterium]
MSVIAVAECRVPVQRALAFERFVDFRNWRYFMPREFRPKSGPERGLRAGDRVRVELDTGPLRVPVPVDVFEVDAPHEIVWGGGNRLLHARHAFRFEEDGDGTRIVSHEVWTGVLTVSPRLARRLKAQAEVVGRAQLGGFARWLEK